MASGNGINTSHGGEAVQAKPQLSVVTTFQEAMETVLGANNQHIPTNCGVNTVFADAMSHIRRLLPKTTITHNEIQTLRKRIIAGQEAARQAHTREINQEESPYGGRKARYGIGITAMSGNNGRTN